MPPQKVLILAMTYMRSGICTAGFTMHPDAVTGLRWVRPVKEHDTLRLGDMTDATGRIVQCGDVVELDLKKPRPDPPHTEDWLTDFVYHRPRLLRRLEGERRARFLATHLDHAPQDVIVHQTRSLCLIRPDEVWARFSLAPQSGKYEARLGFRLGNLGHMRANSPSGVAVTDLKWRALGRTWLQPGLGPAPRSGREPPSSRDKRAERLKSEEPDVSASELALSHAALAERLQATDIYLALGLSRGYRGENWLLVIAVHVVPDYEMTIDYHDL